jgi:hypothetical protein
MKVFSLETKDSAMTFNYCGKLLSIYNKRTRTYVLHSREGVDIFAVHLGDKLLSTGDFDIETSFNRTEKEAAFAITKKALAADVDVDFVLEIKVVDDTLYRLILRVKNNSSEKVKKIIFPELKGLAFHRGGSAKNEFFALPIRTGFICSLQDIISNASTDKYKISMVYPVPASMQWLDFFTTAVPVQGLYLGCHDSEGLYKIFNVSNVGSAGMMNIEFPHVEIEKNEVFVSPAVFVYIHCGDWHAGARLYRSWASSWMCKSIPPEWFINNPAWFWGGCKGQYREKPECMYKDIVDISSIAANYNVKTVHLGGWTEYGHDARYPDYRAGASMGGEKGLISSVDRIKKNGNYITLYINGRIVDPAFTMDKHKNWKENAVHNEHSSPENVSSWDKKGIIMKEKYGKVEFAVMCPGAPWWRKVLKERIRYILENYNVNGIYIDQVCGAIAYCCYSDIHLHDKPNKAWGEYKTLLAEIRALAKSISPNIYLSTEGVNDILGQFFDIQQAHNDWAFPLFTLGEPCPEIFRYTLPWMYIAGGPVEKGNLFLLNIAHLLGGGFDCTINFKNLAPSEEDFIKDLAMAIKRQKDIADICLYGEVLENIFCSNKDFHVLGFMKDNRIVLKGGWIPWEDGKPSEERINKPPARVKIVIKDILRGRKIASCRVDDTSTDITATAKVLIRKNDVIIDFEFRNRVIIEIVTIH